MKQFIGYGLLLVLLASTACNSTRVVKPLQPKEVMVALDAGGPFFEFAGSAFPHLFPLYPLLMDWILPSLYLVEPISQRPFLVVCKLILEPCQSVSLQASRHSKHQRRFKRADCHQYL